MKKLLFFIFIFLFLFSFLPQKSTAQAEDIVIQDDGNVMLVMTNSGVLGITTVTDNPKHPEKTTTQPLVPTATTPITQPHTQSTLEIHPPINNNKKVQVIITTGTATATTPSITQKPEKVISPTPPQQDVTVTKTVDKIVAQGANGQPVLSIKSDKANQLTIQEGTTQVTTSLPLQINTVTHSLSVSTNPNTPSPVAVLPAQAVQGIVDKGLLDSKSISKATISLTQNTAGATYTVDSNRQGKLFGLFPVQSAVHVTFSAKSGKVVTTSQSTLFNLLGRFIQ